MARDIQLRRWDSVAEAWVNINPKTKAELVVGLSDLLDAKVDKVEGLSLSQESFTTAEKTKLDGVAEGANFYEHPENHDPDIITQDADNRFVTDTQITAWDAKEDAANKGVANGYAGLDGNAKIPVIQLPDEARNQTFVVTDSTARNDLPTGSLLVAAKCYETATGDTYIWDGSSWLVLAQADWVNVNLNWGNIVDRPTSSVVNIDDAVDKRHEHSNKTLLDKLEETESNVSYDLAAFLTSVSWEDILSKPEEFPVAAHVHDPEDINTDSNDNFVSDTEKLVWDTKIKSQLKFNPPNTPENVGMWFQELIEFDSEEDEEIGGKTLVIVGFTDEPGYITPEDIPLLVEPEDEVELTVTYLPA